MPGHQHHALVDHLIGDRDRLLGIAGVVADPQGQLFAEHAALGIEVLDRHLGAAGWDQPTRLFGLVITDVLAEAEPALAVDLKLRTTADGGSPGALTAIEKNLPWGRRLTRPVGVILIIAAVAVLDA